MAFINTPVINTTTGSVAVNQSGMASGINVNTGSAKHLSAKIVHDALAYGFKLVILYGAFSVGLMAVVSLLIFAPWKYKIIPRTNTPV